MQDQPLKAGRYRGGSGDCEGHVALGVPPPFIKFSPHLLPAMKHLWFQQALAMPGLGPRLLSDGQQRLPRYLSSHFAASPASLSSEEVDAYIAQLREPNRARAASALYRHLVLPESQRIIRGSYRRTRLRTPTLLLFGAGDSVFPPALTNHLLRSHQAYADHVEVAFVAGASHFIADERPDLVVDRAFRFFAEPARQADLL